MQKDFSYPLNIDDLNQQEQHHKLKADGEELNILKDILQVENVKSFEADIYLKLNLKMHKLDIWGKVKSDLVLKSVVSLENFEKTYEVDFQYYYDTKATYKDIKEMEPSIYDDVPDVVENGKIDLVNIAIEQLALELDDYPRKDGESFEFVSEFDEETTKMANPFAVLEKLKK
ncbi:MAG: DUF177 domain-containing protein [Alphaproteobacteria bacterium]|nr:DUF177 domain-containing protein [Alphaproteobacteria bacterium]